jgi:hypothetical protein
MVVVDPGYMLNVESVIATYTDTKVDVPAITPANIDSNVLSALLPGLEFKMIPRERS